MKMTFLGTTSGGGGCPNIYETEVGTFVVQGEKVTDPELLKIARDRGLPDHETLVQIPRDLVGHFPKHLLAQMAAEAV